MTTEEACALLRISRATLYRMRVRGEVPYYKLNRYVRFKPEDIEALAAGTRSSS